MRIHSDKLTAEDIYAAVRAIPGQTLIHVDHFCEHGSRSRSRAFDVKLGTFYGGPGTSHPRRPNPGTGPRTFGSDVWAASYDDWGYFLAYLFEIDPDAIAGPYRHAADFRGQTAGAYDDRQVA